MTGLADRRLPGPSLVPVLALAGILAVGVPAASAAAGKEDKARLEAELSRILRGRTAETRVTLGRPVTYVAAVVKKQVTRMICTDVQADSGEITYVMPWHVVPVLAKETIPKDSLKSYVEPGAVMRVEQVEIVRTRVGLFLRQAETGHQSLLRIWFSKGFASRLGVREVLEPLADLLVFDGVLGQLLAQTEESRQFPSRVSAARTAHEVGGRQPAARLETGTAYLDLVEAEIGRREAWAELTGGSVDVAELQATRQELDREVGLLVEQVHGPRLAELRQELDRVSGEIATLRDGASGGGVSRAVVDSWRSRVEAWREIVEEYSVLRGSGWLEWRQGLEQGVVEFTAVEREFLLEAEAKLAEAALARRNAIGDAPAASVGALKEQESNLGRFRELIEERRELLGQLDPPAPAEVRARFETDEARLAELESVVARSDEALRPAVLGQQYASLRATRRQLYDRYTLAFGGPKHRAAGNVLIGHLDKMIANRREAAGLGDSAASSQIQELQRFRRQIRSQTP